MWVFKIILFITIAISALFAFYAMGVTTQGAVYLQEIGGTLGVLPSYVWVILALLMLGAILGLANNYLTK